MGARGNSGVIASQIFRGMAEALGGKHRFNGPDLAYALTQGTATAYKAVGKPVEGTILTVIREAAAAAVVAAEEDGDLEDVLTAAVEAAREAVAKTPSLLPVLRDAGVVDAGGQGLYRLMQGTLQYLVSRSSPARPCRGAGFAARGGPRRPGRWRLRLRDDVPAPGRAPYRWTWIGCGPRSRRSVNRCWWRAILAASRSTSTTTDRTRSSPSGLSMGSLTRITVENLDAQSQEVRDKRAADCGRPRLSAARISHRRPAARRSRDVRRRCRARERRRWHGRRRTRALRPARTEPARASIPHHLAALAVVAVSAGEGLARIFDSYGVAAVVHGGQASNPSTGELLDAVEKIDAEEVLLLPNNPNVVLAARQASEMATRRVRVVPTRNAAEGFAALLALDPSRDATANAEVMTLAGRAVQTFQVTEAVRDATIGGRKVHKGQTIVLDPDDGLLAVANDRNKAVLAALEALEPGFELVTLYYGAGADLAEAEAVARRVGEWRSGVEVEVIHGGQPHYRYLIAAE